MSVSFDVFLFNFLICAKLIIISQQNISLVFFMKVLRMLLLKIQTNKDFFQVL